jgi:hypothetical protein
VKTTTFEIYGLIDLERLRQGQLKLAGKIMATCADPIDEAVKLAALTEEVGEVARAVMARGGWSVEEDNLREELVQVAAICVAWLETL